MATRSIIEALDISKDIKSGFLMCCIMLVMDKLGFERVEEALHRCVVIAIGRGLIEALKPADCIILRYSAEAY